MYAVEFQASIQNGVVRIPSEYRELFYAKQAQIFIIPLDGKSNGNFDPKQFFGVADTSKEDIDAYLKDARNEWVSGDKQ